jgi:flagellar basal-body rod modification protein FlgD
MAFPILPILGAAIPAVVGALTGSSKQPTPSKSLGKDDFLRLLVEQIRHQDPLNPLDNDKFIAQQTSFSQLEELQNIRKSLDSQSGTSAGAIASGTAFLGKTVSAASGGFTYAGATVTLPYSLSAPVAAAAIQITDNSGNVIQQIPLGSRPAGPQSFDLTPGSLGKVLGAGQYRYRVVSLAGGQVTPLNAISGTVTGVSMENGVPVLSLGSRRIALADVVSVGMPNN